MNISAFFRQFQRWPTIKAVPPVSGSATATRPRVRYVKEFDLPLDVDAASIEAWRCDSDGTQWFRVVEGHGDD